MYVLRGTAQESHGVFVSTQQKPVYEIGLDGKGTWHPDAERILSNDDDWVGNSTWRAFLRRLYQQENPNKLHGHTAVGFVTIKEGSMPTVKKFGELAGPIPDGTYVFYQMIDEAK